MNDNPPSNDALAIFAQAITLPQSERDEFLRHHCEGNNVLLGELRGLIKRMKAQTAFFGAALDGGMPTEDIETSASRFLGKSIGPYKLLQEIGEGGMGVGLHGRADRSRSNAVSP